MSDGQFVERGTLDLWADTARDQSDRIKELEAKLQWVIGERDATFSLMLGRAEAAEAKLTIAVEALRSVIESCDQGRMIPRSGVGGMTIEANIKGSVYVGVPAWPIEEARTTLAELTWGQG